MSDPKDQRFTPLGLFEPLHAKRRYTVDVAGHPLAPVSQRIGRWWTETDDGLSKSWRGERAFCNPPFSDIEPWVTKAWLEVEVGGCELVDMLLPGVRCEQPWFQRFIEPYRDGRNRGPVRLETHFIAGRTRFGNPLNPEGVKVGSPEFGCVLISWTLEVK